MEDPRLGLLLLNRRHFCFRAHLEEALRDSFGDVRVFRQPACLLLRMFWVR